MDFPIGSDSKASAYSVGDPGSIPDEEELLEQEMAIHSAVATGKGQFSFQSQRRAVPKNVQTTTQIAFISHASKVIFKILQARLQHYMN